MNDKPNPSVKKKKILVNAYHVNIRDSVWSDYWVFSEQASEWQKRFISSNERWALTIKRHRILPYTASSMRVRMWDTDDNQHANKYCMFRY